MTRYAAVSMLLREMAEEMPFVLRALPDDRLWSAMIAALLADEDIETLEARIAGLHVAGTGTADWREVYSEMRDMVNETAFRQWQPAQPLEVAAVS